MRPLWLLLPLLFAGPAPAAPPGCPDIGEAQRRSWVNRRFGGAMDHPAGFVPDPGSVPEDGSAIRFWAADRRATAVVNLAPNREGRGLDALLAEAEGDVLQNGGGRITYRRRRDDWFVISGFMAGRIFYRRTLRLRRGVVATLWMEFPPELRPCLDAAVTMMSLSFRAWPGGGR
jgi:hypothetical protein